MPPVCVPLVKLSNHLLDQLDQTSLFIFPPSLLPPSCIPLDSIGFQASWPRNHTILLPQDLLSLRASRSRNYFRFALNVK